jgi:hypothetical protein
MPGMRAFGPQKKTDDTFALHAPSPGLAEGQAGLSHQGRGKQTVKLGAFEHSGG